jgi:hypothetical protein
MSWRDGNKHHTKGTLLPDVELWTIAGKKLSTAEIAKKNAESPEKEIACSSSRPPRLSSRSLRSKAFDRGAVATSRLSDDARDLQSLLRRQPDELESRANAGGVAHDGDGGEQLLAEPQIDGHRVTDMNIALNDSP